MSTQKDRIVRLLRANPGKKFTTAELAETLIGAYPETYARKASRANLDERQLLHQVAAEISSQTPALELSGIQYDDNRPRRYFYLPEAGRAPEATSPGAASALDPTEAGQDAEPARQLEKDFYLPLMQWLHSRLGLYCLRIRESTSANNRGAGGNKWLHPDIVAMQALDKDWINEVRGCLGVNSTARIRMWSFEVKQELVSSNFREAFFQAVSNSGWASEGYLVATAIAEGVMDDLLMLSSLHGIGLIALDGENPQGSQILVPSRQRELDWQSINRIAEQNADFKRFLVQVQTYIRSDYLNPNLWNRME